MQSTNMPLNPVQEALGLPSGDRAVYVSMCGVDAWTAYRQGAHTSFLFELYARTEMFDVFESGIYAVLTAALRAKSLTDITAPFWASIAALDAVDRQYFDDQIAFLDQSTLQRLFKTSLQDPRVVVIDKLGTFMLDVLFLDVVQPMSAMYRATMIGLWFDLCDTAVAAAAPVGVR